MKFLCRVTDHELSHLVLDAFREGTPDSRIASIDVLPLYYGVSMIHVYYGILRGCKEAIHEDMKAGRPWVYIDHGYFGDHDNVNLTGHYRIVVGGLHHKIPEKPEPEDKNCRMLAPRKSPDLSMDRPLVFIPPSAAVADFYGISSDEWLAEKREQNPNHIVSTKAMDNLDDALKLCRGVVTHSSTAAVKALWLGLPAIATSDRAPVPKRWTYDAGKLVCWLVERQFTLEEIRNGRHLGHLYREVEEYTSGDRGRKAVQAPAGVEQPTG